MKLKVHKQCTLPCNRQLSTEGWFTCVRCSGLIGSGWMCNPTIAILMALEKLFIQTLVAPQIVFITNSFIHYEVLYSAPSRLLLRSAPDPSTAEKDSFEASIERFRVDFWMQAQRQRKPVPEEGANH